MVRKNVKFSNAVAVKEGEKDTQKTVLLILIA